MVCSSGAFWQVFGKELLCFPEKQGSGGRPPLSKILNRDFMVNVTSYLSNRHISQDKQHFIIPWMEGFQCWIG